MKLIFPLLTLTSLACGNANFEITVVKKLQHIEDEIVAETIAATEFFLEYRNLDYYEYTEKLIINVDKYSRYYGPCTYKGIKYQVCYANGLFYAPRRVWIKWLDGTMSNPLMHELLHYSLYKGTGTSDFTNEKEYVQGHTQKFLDLTMDIKKAWIKTNKPDISQEKLNGILDLADSDLHHCPHTIQIGN